MTNDASKFITEAVATLHKAQMLKRVTDIKEVAKNNQTNGSFGSMDIMGAALNHIEEMADAILDDYEFKKDIAIIMGEKDE